MDPEIEISTDTKVSSDLSLNSVKKKAVKGVLALTGRMVILQVISFFATALLTVFLNPSQFGVFFIVSSIVNFYAYFSDIGLSASLIQKKDSPTPLDLKTTFTIQNSLVALLILIILASSPWLKIWFHMDQSALTLLWALAFCLLLSSLKTIPSILMERRLDFNTLVIPQIIEALLYNGVVVFAAWRGFGVASFTLAVLLRGVAGLIATYIIEPWRPGIAFSSESVKSLLKFGLPFQLNSFLAVAKDDGMTAVLGVILGTTNVGLLGWAQKWASAPLRFFMDSVIKVTFPAFSRLQDDKVGLSKAVSSAIFFVSSLVFPMLIGLNLLAPNIIQIIPRYSKWQPALVALGLISINSAWAAVTTPLTNLLSAIGKITVTFKLMIMWTILTWALLPILSIKYGLNGAALGYFLIGLSSIVAITIANRFVKIDFLESVIKPLIAALIMGIVLFFTRGIMDVSIISLIMLSLIGGLIYLLSLVLLVGWRRFSDLLDKLFK